MRLKVGRQVLLARGLGQVDGSHGQEESHEVGVAVGVGAQVHLVQLMVGGGALPATESHLAAPGAGGATGAETAGPAHEPSRHSQSVQGLAQALPQRRQEQLQATRRN